MNKCICKILPVAKRRDGGTRYWCTQHNADATAKYGVRAKKCRYAHIAPISKKETLILNLDSYPGGVALWGAVPPIFDTTKMPLDKGIHVHARTNGNGDKDIDRTFRKVILQFMNSDVHEISELDAIYFMVSSVFGYGLKVIRCSHCGHSHLDKDWFSLHPHKTHLCSGCGLNFRDNEVAIGNPAAYIQRSYGTKYPKIRPSKKKIKFDLSDYPGGIQIWGSNPPILWTSRNAQESGIHIHAFRTQNYSEPDLDETFGSVEINGIELNAEQVRTYMAQLALPHISGRIFPIDCPSCGESTFDNDRNAYFPHISHICSECGKSFKPKGRLRKVISNPVINTLSHLAKLSPRSPQVHNLGLLSETIN